MFGRIKWGIHPQTHKTLTERKAIEIGELPQKVILPVRQHIGAPSVPIVKKGDNVKKGQVVAAADGAVSSNIHASISGTVVDISEQPHPSYGDCLAITIESDGSDQWLEGIPTARDWQNLSNTEILEMIKDAGIVGLGGGGLSHPY